MFSEGKHFFFFFFSFDKKSFLFPLPPPEMTEVKIIISTPNCKLLLFDFLCSFGCLIDNNFGGFKLGEEIPITSFTSADFHCKQPPKRPESRFSRWVKATYCWLAGNGIGSRLVSEMGHFVMIWLSFGNLFVGLFIQLLWLVDFDGSFFLSYWDA